MNDFKLKLTLSVLAGVVFSFIFILLAFVLPAKEENKSFKKRPANLLEEVSKSINK